ncbi:ParB-like protein [Bradyrhizobium sp.]|uniref:ParB-like protein n=1 Tax=Bradyrhizobium sp. TaxID=376 RepID=UPI003D0D9F88
MSVAGSAQAGQASLSSFQTYDPTMASTIVPGTLALFEVPVDSLRSTQLNEGFTEVDKKATGFDLLTPSQLQANLLTDIEPVVIGPGGQLFLTDGHHTFTALQDSIYGPSNPNVFVNVIANYSNLTTAQFFAMMQSQNLLLPLNNGVPVSVNLATGAPFPTSLTGLTEDPYRGLEYSILKNKNSKLFTTTSNITGAKGAATPGLDKMTGFYSDFLEAAAYRGANNGLGLPYLSPGDIAIATQWNLTASSKTTLPNVAGTVTAAQLPGFILSSNITESGVISNATLANGAIDGNGGFTGITTINAGTAASPITIGTPNVGLIMQLGNDNGNTVTLSAANTYTGGTSILAGNLIVASDASLGAAVPAGATINPNNVLASVQAANGIIFNSLTEGNGTLTLGTAVGTGTTTFTSSRPIAVGGEAATININGNIATLGQIVSLGVNGVGIGNAAGISDLTIDDNANNKGVLILSTASPNFFGNLIVGNTNAPTVRVMNDAALGNTTGPAALIGEVELNGGTFQAGASFAAPERNFFLASGSNFDVNGFTTSWGTLTDVQRTLQILNSNATTAGAVTFSSLEVSATATLNVNGGSAGTSVTFANGIIRDPAATLILQPTSGAFGTTEKVFDNSTGANATNTVTNGIVAPWIVVYDATSSNPTPANPYSFATYNSATGFTATAGNSTNILTATGNSSVQQSASITGTTVTGNLAAYALNVQNAVGINLNGNTLTLGDGSHPAGLILDGGASITNGTLATGASELVVWMAGQSNNTNTISAQITGSGGLTFAGGLQSTNPGVSKTTAAGSGTVNINTATAETGAITIDSGVVTLNAVNAFLSSKTGVLLEDTKKSPSPAVLNIAANNAFTALNSVGSNSTININGNSVLTIGDTVNNFSSTLSSVIAQTATNVIGALTKDGSGLLDLSGSGGVSFGTGSTVVVNGGQLRIANGVFGASATTAISLAAGTELQYAGNDGSKFNDPVSGAGIFHLIGGTVQLTSTANTYTGGTVIEQGSTLDLTTANVSSGNANIINAGGLVVFDQTLTGAASVYNGVISDGRQMEATSGPLLSGSLVKDDSTGASSGNLTLAAVQAYSGGTFVEAGSLTLGVANAVASSSGVDLGRVGGPHGTGAAAPGGAATATLILGANNTIQGLMDEAGNNTAVQLGGNTLTLNVASGAVFNYAGVISGTGNLVMSGSGAEFLNGTSTYTGTTTVNGGLLSVNGSIASSSLTTVNAGGALGGTGTVGNTVINGGTLAPGNNSTGAIGTLNVSSSLVFTTAAQYLVQVTQAGASATSVTGSATLAGRFRSSRRPTATGSTSLIRS